MSRTHTLTVERSVPGAIIDVFDAWLDPALLAEFMTPAPGMSVPIAEVNPVAGGRFKIVMRVGDRDLPHEGEYRVIDRPTTLVFTWNSELAGRDTLVSVRFSKLGAHETLVSLTHERFSSDAARDSHRSGWIAILDALTRAIRAG
jgi:uncharacterized protein YndB with AHSA1/START domain